MTNYGYSGNQSGSAQAGRSHGRDGSVFSAAGGYSPSRLTVEQSLRDIFNDLQGTVAGELRRFTPHVKDASQPHYDE